MNSKTMRDEILASIDDHLKVASAFANAHTSTIVAIAECMIKCALHDGAIHWCGNGGSAADSQHLGAELIGRFKRERRAIRSIALTTDSSILTCLGNDYSFADIFARQVEALVRKGDVLVGISTSGNSENVLRAMQKARTCGATTVALLGRDGGKIKAVSDHALIVSSDDTARIQEMHIMVGHIICDQIERAVSR
jgi:D-sedoheptulose 7-phosphate isomerase